MNEPDPITDFADRACREALEDPENLRAILRSLLGPAADAFDVSQRKILPRDFLLPNWQGRERDFLCEIPYRLSAEPLWALVCVLIEHQTQPNPLMPLRTLIYAVFYWEKCLRAWEAMPSPRPPFRLPPVVPIVFHASPKRWSGPRTLAELLDEPTAFHPFAPTWKPLFWEVGEHSAEELLRSEEAFLQVLAMVRAENAEREEALSVYRELLQHLARIRETNAARWTHLLRFALGWVVNRRPRDEKPTWLQTTLDHQNDVLMRQEIENMEQTIAQSWVEEGIKIGTEKGIEKGKQQGIELGRAEMLHDVIDRIGRKRLGEPSADVQGTLRAVTQIGQLDRLLDRVQEVSSWEELFQDASAS